MSGRAAYASGADVYLGANEASALVGAWRQLGSDVTFRNRPQAQVRDQRWERDWDRGRGWGGPGGRGANGGPRREWAPAQYAAPAGQPAQAQWQGGGNERWEWERRHPGHSWHHREHRRQLWDQRYPGTPFVGVEALMGAVGELAGAGSGANGPSPRAWLRDMPPPDMANRQVLPMNTGTTPVPINSTAQITSRPQRVAFRPERVFVSASDIGGGGTAANWIINDITIGNRSQFAQSGALPGDMFASVAIDSFVTFETAQTAMDVVMIVTYQGATEGGTPFFGSIIGTAAV